MKSIITLLLVIGTTTVGFGQGLVDFVNTSSTLISVDGVAMPGSNTRQFIFGLFLAPSNTVSTEGQTISFNDSRFQWVSAYNTNHATASGRLVILRNVDVDGGLVPGQPVDFVVRGWSANAGATWQEALANYNNGFPMQFGSSTVGNDLVLGGGAIPIRTLFGTSAPQVRGFNISSPCLGPCLMGPVYIYPAYSQTVNRGGVVTFTASVYACPPTQRYQWSFNGATIPGATSATYQFMNAQPANAGTYWVVVDNNCSYTLYAYPTLTVLEPPLSQTAETGARVHLAVRAVGNQPQAYRWLFNGSPVLSNATNSVLELDNVQPSQSGSYAVLVTNAGTVVTSASAMVNVIAPVERRMVPRLTLNGQLAAPSNLEYSETLAPTQYWASLVAMDLTNSPDFYFDLTSPLPSQRFYRAWQANMPTNPPTLGLNMIPALTMTGSPGNHLRVDGINQFGPTDAWFTLDTVTLTNTSQLYFDVTAPGQPARLYRVEVVP